MYRKDRTKTGGGLLLYVNENLPGKIINSYKFEISVWNTTWLLLGNYNTPHKMMSYLSTN